MGRVSWHIRRMLARNVETIEDAVAARLCRGVRRLLWSLGYASVAEFPLANGRRADVLGLTDGGEIVIVEIKSSVADFRSDQKWPDYLDYCDSFFFAVSEEFPNELIPESCGLILADAFGAPPSRARSPVERLKPWRPATKAWWAPSPESPPADCTGWKIRCWASRP